MKDKLDLLHKKVSSAHEGGGEARIQKQHSKGKLTARERVELLMDTNSFEEIGMFVTHRTKDFGMDKQIYYGDGVITGYGTVSGRPVSYTHLTLPTICSV